MMLLENLNLDPFFADFDRLSRRLLDKADGARGTVSTSMPMDVLRRDGELVIGLDLPGVQPEDLDVTVDGRTLTIEATRRADERDGDTVYVRGRIHGTQRRRLTLPDDLDVDRVDASYDNGVLTVRIPVLEHAKPRRVEIQRSEAVGAKQLTTSAD
jgi:HSP20 family protein